VENVLWFKEIPYIPIRDIAGFYCNGTAPGYMLKDLGKSEAPPQDIVYIDKQ
jgi:hypothetical protein